MTLQKCESFFSCKLAGCERPVAVGPSAHLNSFEFIFRFLSEPKNIREELRELERVSAMESGGPFFSNAACNALEVNTFTMRRASEAVLELSGSHWQGSLFASRGIGEY